MKNEKIKNYILPIIIILILIVFLNVVNNKKKSTEMTSAYARIYDYRTSSELSSSYLYVFSFEGKIYKSFETADIIKKSKIGKCFKVLFDPKNLQNCQLKLDQEFDCKSINVPRFPKTD